MKEWFSLSENDRKLVIQQVSVKKGLPQSAIEKDWWATLAMRVIFDMEFSKYFIFKGGTSLSKSWEIIERFSEDIDLGLDRSFFGFEGDLSRKGVTRLRKASCKFITQEFQEKLKEKLSNNGVEDFEIDILEFERSDTDPLAIELKYKSLTENIDYLHPRILIEISSRALREPFESRSINSYIGVEYQGNAFAGDSFYVSTVLPSRTLLEKMFLLHEEFQKSEKRDINSQRMSRHLYDISRLMDTEFLDIALKDNVLYNGIIKHREMLTNVSWVDYSKHVKETLNFIPPDSILEDYKKDYLAMQESMFFGKTDNFEDLIIKLKGLNDKINNTD